MLAQTRYESAIYVGSVGLVVIEGWRRAGRVILPPAALCAPLLLIPCALHNVYLSGTPLLWELNEQVSSRFGIRHLWDNLGHALVYFFGISVRLLNVWWLSVTGIAATGWAVWALWVNRSRWRDVPPAILGVLVFAVGVLANLTLLMLYFWGQLDDPIVSRLALPAYAMLALVLAWAVGRLGDEFRPRVCVWLVIGALLSYLALGLRVTAHYRDINQLASEISWEQHWVDARDDVSRLFITNKTGLSWLVRKEPVISVDMVRDRADRVRFHMEVGTFREVLVSQYYRPVGPEGGFILDSRDALPPEFVLEPLIERQFGGRLLRISRVIEVSLPVAPAPPSTHGHEVREVRISELENAN